MFRNTLVWFSTVNLLSYAPTMGTTKRMMRRHGALIFFRVAQTSPLNPLMGLQLIAVLVNL